MSDSNDKKWFDAAVKYSKMAKLKKLKEAEDDDIEVSEPVIKKDSRRVEVEAMKPENFHHIMSDEDAKEYFPDEDSTVDVKIGKPRFTNLKKLIGKK